MFDGLLGLLNLGGDIASTAEVANTGANMSNVVNGLNNLSNVVGAANTAANVGNAAGAVASGPDTANLLTNLGRGASIFGGLAGGYSAINSSNAQNAYAKQMLNNQNILAKLQLGEAEYQKKKRQANQDAWNTAALKL